jgi:hypothetical protein
MRLHITYDTTLQIDERRTIYSTDDNTKFRMKRGTSVLVVTRCWGTDAERRDAYRSDNDSEFQIKPKEASGHHMTRCRQTDAERRETNRHDAEKIGKSR